MPVIKGNRKPGDITYPDYSRITTLTTGTLAAVPGESPTATSFKKGQLYTVGRDGKLYQFGRADVANVTSEAVNKTGTGNNVLGYALAGRLPTVQAMHSALPGKKIQCMVHGSRILLKARTAGIQTGARVKYLTTKGTGIAAAVELHTVDHILSNVEVTDTLASESGTAAGSVDGYGTSVGRVFEIYSKTGTGEEKIVTEANDYVVVDLGVAG